MWLRFKIALLVLIRGEDSFLKPYRDEVEGIRLRNALLEKERDFAVEALQVLSKEAMSHIQKLETELVKRKQKEAYSILSGFGSDKDDLPN